MSAKKRTPMVAETGIFVFIALFFTVVAPIYWFTTKEIAGAWVLGLTAALGWMLTAYFLITRRHVDLRPEDNVEGEITDGMGELGFFPPRSIWPFWCAVCVALIAMGPPLGWWPALLGLGLGIWALTGWVYEFYRGVYKH